jgi:hypothetical protein
MADTTASVPAWSHSRCEDLRLDDLEVAATFYFPRAIHHGQGVMRPILDERADEAQRNALFYIKPFSAR